MAVSALDAPRARTAWLRPWLLVGLVSMTAFAGYASMRLGVGRSLSASFAYRCARFAMRPGDWPCRVEAGRTMLTYVGGSLLVGLAVALPSAVLAATGRRSTAFVPLAISVVVAGGWAMTSALTYSVPWSAGRPYLGMWPIEMWGPQPLSYWTQHPTLASAADLVLLSLPAAAIAVFVCPRRDRTTAHPPLRSTAAAMAACAVASAAFVWVCDQIANHLFASSEVSGQLSEPGAWIVPVVAMAAFGWLLSTDRRWWPWILAPVAVLLTAAASTALIGSMWREMTDLSGFGAAIPYAGVGLIFSFGRPLARRFAGAREEPADEPEAPVSPARGSRGRVRPGVALNATAVSLLLVSLLAFRFDPAPAQFATAFPTYVGARNAVVDLRVRLDLQEGLDALAAYRSANGTFAGFDAAHGEAAAPALAWVDGLPSPSGNQTLRVGVAAATVTQAELVAYGDSGDAFCVRATGGSTAPTYGMGGAGNDGRIDRAVASAVAACGANAWTPALLQPYPIETLCDGVDDGSITICRAVQNLMRQTMRTAAPSGV